MKLTIKEKTKRLDLSSFFNGEEAYLTLLYIPRDLWRYINKLTLKTSDVLLYTKIVNDKEYKKIIQDLKNAKTQKEKKEAEILLNEKSNDLMAIYSSQISKNDLNEGFNIELERNKLLIEHGVDKEAHNFTDDNNNKITLNYEILNKCVFFDYLIQKIIEFNGEHDISERR